MKTQTIIQAAVIATVLCTQQISGAQNSTPEVTMRPAINESYYKTAIGLRAGETSGLTFKHFFRDSKAFEAIVGVWPNGLGLTALYEKHEPAFNLEGMKWYYGGGGHVVFGAGRMYYVYSERYGYFYRYRSGRESGLGIDGILGLEYKIKPIPFALSLDMKPFIEVNTNGTVFMSIDPGLGIKVAF
jgi:hypothetical protein